MNIKQFELFQISISSCSHISVWVSALHTEQMLAFRGTVDPDHTVLRTGVVCVLCGHAVGATDTAVQESREVGKRSGGDLCSTHQAINVFRFCLSVVQTDFQNKASFSWA